VPAGDVADAEVEQFHCRVVVGEVTAVFYDFRSWKLIDSIALVV